MALRRKFKSRRRQNKRKYSSRRKSRMIRRTKKGHLLLKRKVVGTVNIGAADVPLQFHFTIGDINTGSELSNLFDYYKISRIKLTFDKLVAPTQQVIAGSGSLSFPVMPRCYGLIDYNDDDVPVTSLQLREYGNCKVWTYDKSKTFYFKPMINGSVERTTGNTTSVVQVPPTWMKFDNNGSTVRHRGVKVYMEQYPPPSGSTWATGYGPEVNYTITYYVKLKNVR